MNDRPSIFAGLRQQAPYIPKTMRLVWRASGIWMVAWLMLLLVQGALPVAVVYMTRHVIDTLAGIAGKGGTGGSIVFPLVMLGLLLLTDQILLSTGQWVRTIQSNRIQDYMAGLIHVQVMALDLSFYDSSVYYDRLHRARMDHDPPACPS